MDLNAELTSIAEHKAIDFLGVADISGVHDFVVNQGGDIVADYPFSVSIGIKMPHAIVDLLPRNDQAVKISYRHHAYDVINARLDLAASEIGSKLQRIGFRSFPIPASKTVDSDRLYASFSHKLGAHLSGLGWIGKSCLLITSQCGSRVRWATVLTDARLNPTGDSMEERCGKCRKCVEVCPAQAFSGRPFRIDEPREKRYDAKKCELYFHAMKERGEIDVCGLCVYVCPHGRKSIPQQFDPERAGDH